MFLAEDLSSIFEMIDDPSHCAHEICVCLSVDGANMPETTYKMYTEGLFEDGRTLNNALAYFSGAGFMNVICDCEYYNKSLCSFFNIGGHPLFQKGLDDCLNETDDYLKTAIGIRGLRATLFN